MSNCSTDRQSADLSFVEWTITSDFLPEGQRLTAEQMRELQDRLDLPIASTGMVYASDILGNTAMEGELTIERMDAKGAEVSLTYQQGSAVGATVLNQRVIMLNLPKDVPVKSFKIIYHPPGGAKKNLGGN